MVVDCVLLAFWISKKKKKVEKGIKGSLEKGAVKSGYNFIHFERTSLRLTTQLHPDDGHFLQLEKMAEILRN